MCVCVCVCVCEPKSPFLVDLDLFYIVYLLAFALSLSFKPEIVHMFLNSSITNNSYGSHLMSNEPLGF